MKASKTENLSKVSMLAGSNIGSVDKPDSCTAADVRVFFSEQDFMEMGEHANKVLENVA